MEKKYIDTTKLKVELFKKKNKNSERTTMSYKLTYFPFKALAEPIRFLLSYGGVEFEDVRIDRDQWTELKKLMPFGQVPVLEINGKMTHQSVAIARYLAKQMKLTGNNDLEDLEIDAMVDTINDLRQKISAVNKEDDKSRKQALKDQLILETLPFYLERLNNIAESGYLVLGRLTWADLYFVSMIDYMVGVMQMDILENYPHLQALKSLVLEVPGIQKWINIRPHSEY